MFAQFISPPKRVRPHPKPSSLQEHGEEYVLSLAPFANVPKVVFENVPLGTTCKKNLTIRNPTASNIQLFVTRVPQNERRLDLSWHEEVIRSNEEVLLELQWSAEIEGSWRDTISFQDGGRLKKDVPVNFKCIKVKKTKPKPKPAVVSTKIRSPLRRKLSPAKKFSPVKLLRKPLPDITNLPTVIVTSSETSDSLNVCRAGGSSDKENFFGVRCAAANITFGLSKSKLKSPVRDTSSDGDDEFDDSLESPRKRGVNVLETLEEKIGRLALTPCANSYSNKGGSSVRGEVHGTETYTKLDISSSTQIKDSMIDLTSPKSTIANCTLSPIRNVEINKTFEMGKRQNRLDLITEEASGDCTSSINRISTKVTKFTKAKPLNLKEYFEKSNVGIQEPKTPREFSVKLHDTQRIIHVQNPFVLTATNDIDPFISSSIYYNLQWVDEQERSFKKWLNALLTPPLELDSDTNIQIDVGKLWNDCKKREISKAPSREVISNTYHVKTRLDSLRKSAFHFLTSPEMSEVLSKVSAIVDNNKLQIRSDRDIHLDLSLQAEIMILFISYNPLWLRIGLEMIYGVTIPLNSNSDILGLSLFISNHYFKDPYLLRKHKSLHSPKYSMEIKKFALKKFLMLVYFLDQAKSKQLIPHNPCLFSKKAPYKESREILLKFSRELLFAVGDVTKFLRHFGYVLGHRQTYIHEFDYAVSDLGTDLRDGVRLTRVMEIILLRDGLVENLRAPAISRLQKVHNVKMVFDALTAAGLTILHDIQPKDIVDGHREKTLSFLWQIIYKFEAPRLKKAVVTIQMWWRSLAITLKRKVLRKSRQKQLDSAVKIQRWYKRVLLSRMYKNLIPIVKELMVRRQMENAAVKIQSFLKMVTVKRNFLKLRTSLICLQSYSRRWLVLRRTEEKLAAVIKIQSFYRMCRERRYYLRLKSSVRNIENLYLSKKLTLKTRNDYLLLKSTVSFVQEKYHANKNMNAHREKYLQLKRATLTIQRRYRATKQMLRIRQEFLQLKSSARAIQQRYRAKKLMQKERDDYLKLRSAAIFIQRKFRANRLMKKESQLVRANYLKLKESVTLIQSLYRAKLAMKSQRDSFKKLRNAAILIQMKYRAKILMRNQRSSYQKLREATIKIQAHYRGYVARKVYEKLTETVVWIQRRYRAKMQIKQQSSYYRKLREVTIRIQTLYRAKLAMKRQRDAFEKLRNAAILIQRKYRAKILMRNQRSSYQKLREATIKIQAHYRGYVARKAYEKLTETVVWIQRRYRAKMQIKQQSSYYQKLREVTIRIQTLYRAKLAMKRQRDAFEKLRNAAILIQRKYRAKILMRNQRSSYQKLKEATIKIQAHYRGYVARKAYEKLTETVVWIQRRYRVKMQIKQQSSYYRKLREVTIRIQTLYRAKLVMKRQRDAFEKLRNAAILIQRKYRAKILMCNQRNSYRKKKVQKWYRSPVLLVIKLQARIRGFLMRRKVREEFSSQSVGERRKTQLECRAAVKIQAYWRGYFVRSRGKEKRTDNIRQKLTAANRKYTRQDTLKSRMEKALMVCGNHGSTYELNKALKDLDICTRVSRKICVELSGTISEFLYDTISLATRSEPEREMLALSASILINFWRVAEAREAVWCPDRVDAIVAKMTHWCDKDNPVFVHLCTLLWLFAHNNRCRRIIAGIPQGRQRFTKIRTFCERKHKMLGRSTNCTVVSFFGPYKGLPSPSLEPDWGIEYQSRPRIFRNSMQAIESLVNILNVIN